MKKLSLLLISLALLLAPMIASAAGVGLGNADASGGPAGVFLQTLIGFTNGVLIPFIIGIGFLFFVWGMFQYFIAGGANDDKKEKGKSLMIYATLGFVLIIVFWGIINLLSSSTGLDDAFDSSLLPTAPGGTP